MSAGEIVTVVAAVGAAIVGIVNSIGMYWGHRERQAVAATTNDKLDQIHVLTNSRLSDALESLQVARQQLTELRVGHEATMATLTQALARIDALESLLHEYGHEALAAQLPPVGPPPVPSGRVS